MTINYDGLEKRITEIEAIIADIKIASFHIKKTRGFMIGLKSIKEQHSSTIRRLEHLEGKIHSISANVLNKSDEIFQKLEYFERKYEKKLDGFKTNYDLHNQIQSFCSMTSNLVQELINRVKNLEQKSENKDE